MIREIMTGAETKHMARNERDIAGPEAGRDRGGRHCTTANSECPGVDYGRSAKEVRPIRRQPELLHLCFGHERNRAYCAAAGASASAGRAGGIEVVPVLPTPFSSLPTPLRQRAHIANCVARNGGAAERSRRYKGAVCGRSDHLPRRRSQLDVDW